MSGNQQDGGEIPVVANLQYGGEYRQRLLEAADTGRCIFCQPEFQSGVEVVAAYRSWFARKNNFPTKDAEGQNPKHHFLIVSKRHIRWFDQILMDGWFDIMALCRIVRNTFDISGGGLAIRFDDPLRSGATILHAHFHMIVPRIVLNPEHAGTSKAVPVYFPIG